MSDGHKGVFKEAFKEMLLEKNFRVEPHIFRRSIKYEIISQKALIAIGVRRSGKTTFLKQICSDLIQKQKISENQIVYINFSDERLLNVQSNDLQDILSAHHELFPELEETQTVHYFLDEIQMVKNWELFVDRLIRSSTRQVYITGSSSKLLSKEIATQMRGRSISYEIFPFGFTELLEWEGIETKLLSTKKKAKVYKRFEKYLFEGGFPEVVHQPQYIQRKILQEYFTTLLMKDVIERHNPSNPVAVQTTLNIAMNQISGLYTINKLFERLKSLSFKVQKSDVTEYLDWFQEAYALFSVPIFVESFHKQNVNPKKISSIDNGLTCAVSTSLSKSTGHLLENLVFLTFRRLEKKIYYFRDRYQHEVDFVVLDEFEKPVLYQVSVSLKEESVKERELKSLFAAMKQLNLKKATLFTLNEKFIIEQEKHKVYVRPLWEFLLEVKM